MTQGVLVFLLLLELYPADSFTEGLGREFLLDRADYHARVRT